MHKDKERNAQDISEAREDLELTADTAEEETAEETTAADATVEDTDSAEAVSAENTEITDGEAAATPKKKLPAWVIWPVIGVIVLIAVLATVFGGKGKKTASNELTVVEASTGNIKEVYNANGTIESENTKTYYSPVTAPVSTCNAEVGKAVKKGELLIGFDTTNLERDNQQAQLTLQSSYNSSQAARDQNAKSIAAAVRAENKANQALADQANALADTVDSLAAQLNQAEAIYAESQAKHDSPEVQKRIAELKETVATKEKEIQEYQLRIETDSVIYDSNGVDYQRALSTPEDKRTPAQKQLIEAVQAYQYIVQHALPEAQAALEAAKAELASLDAIDDGGYGALYEQYTAAYSQWEAAYNTAMKGTGNEITTGMSSSELANLDISDNLAELTALAPEELLAKAREGMKADMDGVIAAVQLEGSNTAAQGAALYTIASMENVRVKVEISPDDYARMKVGNPATITVGDKKYKGTLASVDKIAIKNAKGNPVIGARIHIDNPDKELCIGATAKVSMTVAESKGVLVVPTEAVNASTDGDFVFVIENGVVRKKAVELGTASTTQVEIKSGLKKGDQVVNDLNVDIKDGMKATAK